MPVSRVILAVGGKTTAGGGAGCSITGAGIGAGASMAVVDGSVAASDDEHAVGAINAAVILVAPIIRVTHRGRRRFSYLPTNSFDIDEAIILMFM
jgi:hypothetical protein